MPWHINVHSDLPIIETCYEGILSPSELAEAVEQTLAIARAREEQFLLADCTTLIGGHSLFDLYALVDVLLASGIAQTLKEAILFSEMTEAAEKVKFWETTCLNRGIQVRIFTDRQSALEWLMG